MSGIIRIQKSDNYTHISNIPANNKELSWEARGVLYYLLTKPNGWQCRNRDLINKGPAGEEKIERILDELQAAGYISRKRVQNSKGLFDWETTIYESPIEVDEATAERLRLKKENQSKKRTAKYNKTIGGLSTDGKTIGGLSTPGLSTPGESPYIVNTESVINKSVNTKNVGASKTTRPPLSLTCKILVEETGKSYLNSAQLKETDKEVGNTPASLQKWRETVKAWNLNGNNPRDAQGMLDWFRSGKRSNYESKQQYGKSGIIPKITQVADSVKARIAQLDAESKAQIYNPLGG